MNECERRKILQSIENRNGAVTVEDVTIDTGLSLFTVAQEIGRLASTTEASIDTFDNGQLVYRFKTNVLPLQVTFLDRLLVITKLFHRSLRIAVCGFMIATSLVVTTCVLSICLLASILLLPLYLNHLTRESSDRGRDQIARIRKHGNNDERAELQVGSTAETELCAKDVVTNCITYMLGRDEPRVNPIEQQMQLIARLIVNNNGVITPDQLMPYIYRDFDESIFSILKAFEGQPLNTESGSIIYRFPLMASDEQEKQKQPLPPYLEEQPRDLDETEAKAIGDFAAMGALSVLGSLWLRAFFLLFNPIAELLLAVNFMLVSSLISLALPVMRYFYIAQQNKAIRIGNLRRAALGDLVRIPSPDLQRRLEEAKKYRHSKLVSTKPKVIYTTANSVLEQADAI